VAYETSQVPSPPCVAPSDATLLRQITGDGDIRSYRKPSDNYEWQKPEDPKQPKQPFYHRLPDEEPFAFAGLWTTATPKDAEEPITSCSIITTAANREVRVVHDRMPVILDGPDAEAAWLSADVDLDAGGCPGRCRSSAAVLR
jgi:hypothetical protein